VIIEAAVQRELRHRPIRFAQPVGRGGKPGLRDQLMRRHAEDAFDEARELHRGKPRAAGATATPGKLPQDWQTEAESVIEKELVDLGLLTLAAIRKQAPDEKAFRKYFMHGIGHPLGLDVHGLGRTTGPIQKGWVLAVEPGIYIREEGLAVRLENDILVQDGGNKDLMANIPIEADEITDLMNR
jgi:hypothetical protein